jgi:tetratricopeptide (TPR) repeat protein
MKNIQTCILKILLIGSALFVGMVARAEYIPAQLTYGDSLFAKKQYTQSFERYQSLYESGRYTPAMLLKMAYIQEGLGRISQSIYYLQLYYKATNDEQALNKIEELATKHKLEGYTASVEGAFRNTLQKYQLSIRIMLLAMGLFSFALIIYQKRKQYKPMGAGLATVFMLGLLFAYVNLFTAPEEGIVSDNQTYLMSGPSAGSSVIAIINEGHQLKIKDKKDVWLKVEWREKNVYVKGDKLLRPTL